MTPATSEPSAHRASSTPAIALSPSESAKATVTTSVEPNRPPNAKLISATGSSSRHGIATLTPSVRPGCGGGSVLRSEQKTSVPTSPKTIAATRPAAGSIVVASTVASGGPERKMHSSTTASSAKAVCRSAGFVRAWVQRARTAAPTAGMVAPASAAKMWGSGTR